MFLASYLWFIYTMFVILGVWLGGLAVGSVFLVLSYEVVVFKFSLHLMVVYRMLQLLIA